MGKNAKIIIFSLIGLAVLGGVAALLMLTAPQDTGTAKENDEFREPVSASEGVDLTLCSRDESEILSVEVTNAYGSFTITPSGNTDAEGKVIWTIEGLAEAPLNSDALDTAAGYAASFDAREFAETAADSSVLAKYGLDAPQASFVTTFADNTRFELKIGNDVPNSTSAVYVTPDDKNVYTAYKSRTGSFTSDKYSFVSVEALPAYDQSSGEEVIKFTVTREDRDEPLVIENIIDEEAEIQVYSYRMSSPYTAYLDLTDGPAFVYSIFGLNAAQVMAVGKGAEDDIKSYVTDEVYCTITAETNVRTYTLTLGRAMYETETGEDGTSRDIYKGRYGISSEHPGVLYFFSAGSLTAVHAEPEKLISRLFLMPYIYGLGSIEYSDSTGRKLDLGIELLQKAEENKDEVSRFTVNGEEWDDQQFKDLYQYLISAAGEELYLDGEKGVQLAEITYNYIDPSDGIGGRDVVTFYESADDRKVIIALNGENLFKTRRLYVTQLFNNIDSFLSGGEIILTY